MTCGDPMCVGVIEGVKRESGEVGGVALGDQVLLAESESEEMEGTDMALRVRSEMLSDAIYTQHAICSKQAARYMHTACNPQHASSTHATYLARGIRAMASGGESGSG
jgi:hypothetical protein